MGNNGHDIDIIDVSLVDEELLIITADKLLTEAGDNLSKRGDAINEICQQLFSLNDKIKEEIYIIDLSKRFHLSRKLFQDKIKTLRESSKKTDMEIPAEELPDGIDDRMARKLGFFTHKGKYFFITKDGLFKASNFVIKPLLHIYSKIDNKRMIEIENEFGEKRLLDLPSKNMTSVEQFQAAVYNEGHYIFYGTKIHFMKLLDSISRHFTIANEIKTLGWQSEGFYAFANGIYNGTWQPVDELGVTGHKKSKYYLPAFSCVYKDIREDDDEYENDRYFIWQQSTVSFDQWASLMKKVYGEKSTIAISFMIASIFRNVIYEKYKIFPHLFLFGEKQSGKSQLAWSLSNVFFNNLPAFNLNSGTQVGFSRRLSRVRNGICWFDEYTNDIDEKRFQNLKSAYDGMGHEKGKMTRDNRTEITKVNSASMISGQYLPTRDDNALFTRSIVLFFERKIYSEEEMSNYDKLKTLELSGLSSIIGEILKFSKEIDVNYGMTFSELLDKMKGELLQKNAEFDERLLRNFVCILTPVKIILNSIDYLNFPFSWKELYDLSLKMISDLSVLIDSSEAVASFWNTVEFMLDVKPALITEGDDFKIENQKGEITLKDKNGKEKTYPFESPELLLFIRFTKIHPLYMEAHRRQHGKNGVDMVSIEHYFKNHPAFLGTIKSTRFFNTNTSAFVFRYKELNVNLVRDVVAENRSEEKHYVNPNLTTEPGKKYTMDDLPF